MASAAPERQIFNPRLVAGLVAAGILAFAAFVLLTAYADDFRSGRDGRPHALSVSAVGFHGLVRLVELAGGTATFIRSERDLDHEELLVVAVEMQTDPDALRALLARRGSRATLLILPKWMTIPDNRHPGWVASAGIVGVPEPLEDVLEIRTAVAKTTKAGALAGQGMAAGIVVQPPARSQTVAGTSLVPLISAPGGGALLAKAGERPLYILADPDLMNNQGLKSRASAAAALQILAALNSTGAQSVDFDLTLNGFGAKRSALKLPFEPPFLALTIALFVAALLAGLHGAFRFGPEAPEERAIAFGKMALVENSAGLIQLVRREHRTGGAYVELMREEAAHAFGAPPGLQGAQLEAYLDRLSRSDGPRFSSLADQARNASTRFELLGVARALFQWKKDNIQ